MPRLYKASFFCNGCGLENTFTFRCSGVDYDAEKRASTLTCPSGCNPQRSLFELTGLDEMDWETAFDVSEDLVH